MKKLLYPQKKLILFKHTKFLHKSRVKIKTLAAEKAATRQCFILASYWKQLLERKKLYACPSERDREMKTSASLHHQELVINAKASVM